MPASAGPYGGSDLTVEFAVELDSFESVTLLGFKVGFMVLSG